MTYFDHDFKKYPELTNAELETMRLISPHPQLEEDFYAEVVKVHDGDTITLKTDSRDFTFPLRFLDIDAPELSTGIPGLAAKEYVEKRLLGQEVKIIIDRRNRVGKYGRLLGRVLHAGTIVNDDEIRLGLAKPFSQRYEDQFPDMNRVFMYPGFKEAQIA
jgi:endonuclease YncB( thermonuclease family)